MRADFANRSLELLLGYAKLFCPIPDFIVLVHIDAMSVADLLCRIIRHWFSFKRE